jgi:DNA polymerase III epsilon subunit family exonuclease
VAPYIVPAKLNLDKEVPRQYVVFDLETTGLTAVRHEIIEIGAILVDRDTSRKRIFQTLVVPTKRIPSRITQITGITQGMVNEGGLSLDCAMSEFTTFTGDLPLIAYNASFDMGFLRAAAERCSLSVRNQHTCAMKMARRAFPTLENHKLGTVSVALNFRSEGEDEGTHRAVGDCRRTVHVYQAAAKTLGLRLL